MTFEGVADPGGVNGPNLSVADFYNGGTVYTGAYGQPAGPNYGVDFSNNGPGFAGAYDTQALCDGSIEGGCNGNTSNDPSGTTVITFFGGLGVEMDVAGGFTALDFFYSEPVVNTGAVSLFDAQGNLLFTEALPQTSSECAPPSYCMWNEVNIPTITGVGGSNYATEALFTGQADFITLDNISINECSAASPVCVPPAAGAPEPSTWLLFGTGALLMVFGSRKLKLRKNQASS
jgi:hypothetical protein